MTSSFSYSPPQSSPFQINPQNPYVFNPNYYANLSPDQLTQNSLIYHLLHYNSVLSSISGLFFIGLVVYLVTFQTPQHFRPYSKMLFLCAITDTNAIMANFFAQTRLHIIGGKMLATIEGPASMFSYKIQCLAISWHSDVPLMSASCLPVQYFIRYRAIKSGKPPTTYQIVSYFLIAVLLNTICLPTTFGAFCTYPNEEHMDFSQFWYPQVPVPQLLVSNQSYPPMLIHLTYMMGLSTISYALSIFFAKRSLTALNQQTTTLAMSSKTKQLQEQLAMTLFAQSLCPLVTAVMPILFTLGTMLFGISTDIFGDFAVICVAWVPCLNALTAILLIAPYRKHCLGWFPCSWRKKKPVNNTSVIPATSFAPVV